MPEFERLSESDLDRLDDEALVAYLASARRAGEGQGAKRAAGVLAFRFWDRVRARVALKTPSGEVDDVAMAVMESVVKSAFDGKVIGQFGAWINTITARRIADFHRGRQGRPELDPLPEEHEGAEEIWGAGEASEADTATLEYRDAAERVLAERNPLHERVIRLYGPTLLGFLDLSAAEAAAQIEGNPGERISEENIHQIWSRFRRELEEELRGERREGNG